LSLTQRIDVAIPKDVKARLKVRVDRFAAPVLRDMPLAYKVATMSYRSSSRVVSVSDQLSAAMKPFFSRICEIGRFPRTYAVDIAIDLIRRLAKYSYAKQRYDIAGHSSTGLRPSDIPADLLLRRLISKGRYLNQKAYWTNDNREQQLLKKLNALAGRMENEGIHGGFGRSTGRLKYWVDRYNRF